MSIDHIKKQAKRLSQLLPEYLATHKDPTTLSACQELAAKANGYPSFHAAVTKSLSNGQDTGGTESCWKNSDANGKGRAEIDTSLFADIMKWADKHGADDIDFNVDHTSSKSQVAFGVDGRYIRPDQYLLPTDSIVQMLGSLDQFDIHSEKQSNVSVHLPKVSGLTNGSCVSLRTSTMKMNNGVVVSMHIQRREEVVRIRSLDDAGFLDSQIALFNRVISSGGGIVAIAGIARSGKSTTLDQLAKLHLVYNKLEALRIDEIRDEETGRVAKHAVESGKAVYSAVHANSALGIVERLSSQSIGIPREALGSPKFLSLLGYQALLPTTCPHCGKTPDEHAKYSNMKGKELDAHQRYFDRLYRLYAIDPSCFRMRNWLGCEHCRKVDLPDLNGFAGRTVVSELIELDEIMLSHISAVGILKLRKHWRELSNKRYDDPNMTGKTAMECAVYKASQGLIDPREIEPRFRAFEAVEAQTRSM